jgi:hypothetical protein
LIINTDDYEIVWMDGKTKPTPLYVNDKKGLGFIMPPSSRGDFQIVRRGSDRLCERCGAPGVAKLALNAEGFFTLGEPVGWVVRCNAHFPFSPGLVQA